MTTRQDEQQQRQPHDGHGQQPQEPETQQEARSQHPAAERGAQQHKPAKNEPHHGTGSHAVLNSGRSTMVQDIRDAIRAKYNQIFMLTAHTGDILENQHGYGVYFHDTEYLDQMELHLNGQLAISLLADASDGAHPIYELANPDLELGQNKTLAKERLSIQRGYTIGNNLVQHVTVRNMDKDSIAVDLDLVFASQFTNMFVVRGAEPGKRGTLHPPRPDGSQRIVLRYDGADEHLRTTTISFSPTPTRLAGGTATYHLALKPRQQIAITATIALEDQGPAAPWEQRMGKPHVTSPDASTRHKQFQSELSNRPSITTSNTIFDTALQRSFDDISMLAIANHGDVYIAAGVPWYVALFGRDSCISAYQMLAFNSALARTTLRVLASLQGDEYNDFQDEDPGKILHELRTGEKANLEEVPQIPYYGTVDATPLFLILMADYVRWTADLDTFKQLESNVARALEWCDANPTHHGGQRLGFVRYGTRSAGGLTNQGWKDSGNSIVNTDGSLCEQPIALVEVQGYIYRAKVRIAELYRRCGDARRADELERQAEDLKQRFNQAFWQPKINYYALCLQRDDRPSLAVASNPGQALFGAIVAEEHAQAVADRLLADDMYSGWGIRTLSAKEAAYNPLDYQVGSIWPHDNSLIAVGLWEYGCVDQMERVFSGIFNAAAQFRQRRLPEVFDGFSVREYNRPVHYPVACSPQAWAAGTLPLLLRTALGLDAHALDNRLHIRRPHLPPFLTEVNIQGLRVGAATVDLRYLRQGQTTLVAVPRRQGKLEVHIEY